VFSISVGIEFDTSCFTGKYVTGEKIGDDYFQKLHNMRNDSAQELRRRGSVETIPSAPHSSVYAEGCESVHNDIRDAKVDRKTGCEGI
jgi:amidophosphoribosyltransferase